MLLIFEDVMYRIIKRGEPESSGTMHKATAQSISPELVKQSKTYPPIPQLVWIIGSMMFLVNLSFIMVYSYVGIYMKSLGVTMAWIGVVEGLAEASSFLMKLLSGIYSDFLKRRKPVMLVGYTMIVFSRIVFSLAATFAPLFAARLVERLGNGIQSTPRDTMVADVSPPSRIGAAYGLKRTLAQSGSLLGAIVAMFAFTAVSEDYQSVFQLAAVPAVVAFLILIFFVIEPKKFAHSAVSAEIPLPPEQHKRSIINLANLAKLGSTFWLLMGINAIFMLSRFSETFLSLHAYNNFGLAGKHAPLIMLVFNAGWVLSSYPVGVMADRMNRYWFLALGILFLILADHFLATATSLKWIFIGCFFWGVQYGVTQNIFLSLVAENVPVNLRGTGFGSYYIICAISAYFADHLAGTISQHHGEASAFSLSGVIAIVSLLALLSLMIYKTKNKRSK